MPANGPFLGQFRDAVIRNDFIQCLGGSCLTTTDTKFTYSFENFFHPYVGELVEQLNRKSLAGLLDPDFLQALTDDFFEKSYPERVSDVVGITSRPKEIDLSESGPYSCYNWELLFHVPLTIAVHLSKNRRFAEARRWFHYIFDPTSTDTSQPVPQRFWKFLAFRKAGQSSPIDVQLQVLSKPLEECSADELQLKQSIITGYEAIKNHPFAPHMVARTRIVAYQYNVVMKYLDNLIAWGDDLFAQDTVESIVEATQLYVLAANLLGRKPQPLPRSGVDRPTTYFELRNKGLDELSNALIDLENKFPLSLGSPAVQDDNPDAAQALFGVGRTLYFCIPRNEKMLGYWDTVADRLFKIRNCMNIQGVVRQLALFDPPLDPGLLVKAAAAGLDIGAVVNGLNEPVSPVRALQMIAQARDLCAELRNLGSALLSAIEKGDAEALAQLRSRHEIQIQQMQQEVRFLQWANTQESTKSLLVNRKSALERLHYYQRLLGSPADPNAPDELELNFGGLDLTEENFAEAYHALVGQYDKPLTLQQLPNLALAGDTAPTVVSGYSGNGHVFLSHNEDVELNVHLPIARDTTLLSAAAHSVASTLTPIPDPKVNLHFWGLGGTIDLKVGTVLSTVARLAGDILGITAGWEQNQAAMASRYASYERRADEWILQHNLAAHELMQIGRQILTSLIAEQIARHDYLTVKQQIVCSQEIDQTLRDKFSNADLYGWMQGELSRLYYEYYRFTCDTARRAEQLMKRELFRPEVTATDYIKFNYWDGGRKGLLCAEALYLDIKRMETAYHDNNKREYELMSHVSLRQLAPAALMALKTTGSCEVSVPEWVFDLDAPGHYMRRIRSVGLSIPCVNGPYTSLNCTLTLTKSSLRTVPSPDGDYPRQGSNDSRFIDYYGAAQSIVTSNGQNDRGLFDTSGSDGRLLPFEGAGVESRWTLQLPSDYRQFDYATISDAVLHIQYTARDGGQPLREAASANLDDVVADSASGLALLFSLKRDFPSEWSAFVNSANDFNVAIPRTHFPYLTATKDITIAGFELFLLAGTNAAHRSIGTPVELETASESLRDNDVFTFSAEAGDQKLPRVATADPWLIVRYTLA